MLHDNKTNKVHIVRFPKNHPCDEKEHKWSERTYSADHHAYCPECCSPGRGRRGPWSVVYGKEVFYVDFARTPPRFSKI
jgi:hypothetical protein